MNDSNKGFSSKFHTANQRVEKIKREYEAANDADVKARLELIAVLESNMDFLKAKFAGHDNYSKQRDLLSYVDYQLFDIPRNLENDKLIARYLNKHGFLSPCLYVIIDLLIICILSIASLIIGVKFFDVPSTPIVCTYWIIGGIIIGFLLDITTYMNFYKVKK